MKKPRSNQEENRMHPHVWRLYSGTFQCPSCGVELELRRVRNLECPECGGRDLEQIDDDEEEGER